jgi:triphosphoribosyl-dephospho-CoA synthase
MTTMPIGQCASLACLLEVSAPKVGNVHRGADFPDLTLDDFLLSAIAIGPAMERASTDGVGRTALAAIQATRALVSTNTNLGIVLLLAPLAAVPADEPLETGVARVLADLSPDDAAFVYQAIRAAEPGGMGEVESMDVADAAPPSLLDAMRAAADRDLVARQYVTDFRDVFERAAPAIVAGRAAGLPMSRAIVHAQMQILAREPDSLIARKAGLDAARRASAYAAAVLDCGDPLEEDYERALADFDFWLRSDGKRRNPGTTADLITAGLFAALRSGRLAPPFR